MTTTTTPPDTDDGPRLDWTVIQPGDRLISAREAAEIIGSDEGTLRQWRYEHVGPPYVQFNHRPPKPGRRPTGKIRYPDRMLRVWMQARLTVPDPLTAPDG